MIGITQEMVLHIIGIRSHSNPYWLEQGVRLKWSMVGGDITLLVYHIKSTGNWRRTWRHTITTYNITIAKLNGTMGELRLHDWRTSVSDSLMIVLSDCENSYYLTELASKYKSVLPQSIFQQYTHRYFIHMIIMVKIN